MMTNQTLQPTETRNRFQEGWFNPTVSTTAITAARIGFGNNGQSSINLPNSGSPLTSNGKPDGKTRS